MNEFAFEPAAHWIWSARAKRPFNNFVHFRRVIDIDGAGAETATLHLTADSRYELFVNGEWVGHGPIRSWPSPWPVDEYDLRALLKPGVNVLSVLVQHIGIGTFQYQHAEPGLLAQMIWRDGQGEHRVVTDASWDCRPHEGYAWPVPRISIQQAWEEQFDARLEGEDWTPALPLRRAGEPPHERFEPRPIPFLTREVIEPARVAAVEAVRAAPYSWSLDLRSVLNPHDRTANVLAGHLLLATHIHSPAPQAIQFHVPHKARAWKLNGEHLRFDDYSLQATDDGVAHARLRAGENTLLCRLPAVTHAFLVTLNVWTEQPVRADAWIALGPFGETPGMAELEAVGRLHRRYITASEVHPDATDERFRAIWERGAPDADDLSAPWARPLTDAESAQGAISPVDVFALCASERVVGEAQISEPAALLRDNADWTTVPPAPGADVRLLLDFGREVVGYHEFELDAPAGAVLDAHCFEFIQHDGRINLCEGMNNAFRYTCREGVQRYRTFVRRGFRYCWLTLRRFERPIRIRFVRALLSTYPVAGAGDFACSDERLNHIWHVGAYSVRCCAEDAYTDCPTYEQTHWVGDARNEALVDLIVNGDPRLSRHCWIQAGRSLDRSPIVESQVPSAWENLLPAWSFLWMRWAQEHYQRTGDLDFARTALGYLGRNVRGIEEHLNPLGLFEIVAWNMFDWAPMDTPSRGVVTHQNCLAVQGLRQAALLARAIDEEGLAERWIDLADRLSAAINGHLWSESRQAYLDCLHHDGTPSAVFSQQTQTAAYIAGVAADAGAERAERCRAIIEHAPPGFVEAGSPFFMFFALEGMIREGRFDALVQAIRDYWGPQIAAGATTFWEMYHPEQPRLTRSHCHGWSAAPTFFLSEHVLGVQPLEPGYARVRIAPQPADLAWAWGRVPTPRGVVECAWSRDAAGFSLRVTLPPQTPAQIELPFDGEIALEAGEAAEIERLPGALRLVTEGPRLKVRVQPPPPSAGEGAAGSGGEGSCNKPTAT